jgi:EF hand
MKKLILTLAVATLGFAGFALPSLAQDAAKGEMDYMKVDANADGSVTMEEATAAGWKWTADQFKAADTDANGSLSADEFVTATKA